MLKVNAYVQYFLLAAVTWNDHLLPLQASECSSPLQLLSFDKLWRKNQGLWLLQVWLGSCRLLISLWSIFLRHFSWVASCWCCVVNLLELYKFTCQYNFFCWSEAVIVIMIVNEQHFMKISDIYIYQIYVKYRLWKPYLHWLFMENLEKH